MSSQDESTSAAGAAAPAPTRAPLDSATHKSDVVRVGVIGYGYWGPNIVRNLHGLEKCQLVAVCDKNPAALKRAQKISPALKLTTDFAEILTSTDIDAGAVVTPVWTHFELAKAALEN